MNRETLVPQNPVLTRCMLVESKFQSRSEAMRMLRSGNLFHTVFEAFSLNDALTKLQVNEFDTCLIGSSVSPDRAEDFVARARQVTRAKDCSFLVFTPSHEPSREIPGADAVISWPCTSRSLHEQLVKAVTHSHEKARYLKMYAQLQAKEPGIREVVRDTMGTEHLIEHQARRLSGIQRAIRSGRMGLNSLGRPDRTTDHAITRVVDGLIARRVPEKTKLNIRSKLIRVFREWVVSLVLENPKEANNQLRVSLEAALKEQEERAQ